LTAQWRRACFVLNFFGQIGFHVALESDSRDADQADSTPQAGGEIVSSETSFRVNDFGETVSFRSSQAIETEASLEPGEQFEPGEPAQPEAVGRYRIESILGQGGFGAVYRGFDEQLDRPVAIKVPLLNRESGSAQDDFLREARQLAKLAHPGIVSVFDIGVADSRCDIVTEFLEGTDLTVG
jgi:serine/threonine protein kinase